MFKKYYQKRRAFVCPNCGHKIIFYSVVKWIAQLHLFDIWRYIKCPNCGKRSWMKRESEEIL